MYLIFNIQLREEDVAGWGKSLVFLKVFYVSSRYFFLFD